MTVAETEVLTCPKTGGEDRRVYVPSLCLLGALHRPSNAGTPVTLVHNNQYALLDPYFIHSNLNFVSKSNKLRDDFERTGSDMEGKSRGLL
jgi:hypothetical protein